MARPYFSPDWFLTGGLFSPPCPDSFNGVPAALRCVKFCVGFCFQLVYGLCFYFNALPPFPPRDLPGFFLSIQPYPINVILTPCVLKIKFLPIAGALPVPLPPTQPCCFSEGALFHRQRGVRSSCAVTRSPPTVCATGVSQVTNDPPPNWTCTSPFIPPVDSSMCLPKLTPLV